MKNLAYVVLSLAVIAAAYMLTGTSSMVTTTNDVAAFCRAAGFVTGPTKSSAVMAWVFTPAQAETGMLAQALDETMLQVATDASRRCCIGSDTVASGQQAGMRLIRKIQRHLVENGGQPPIMNMPRLELSPHAQANKIWADKANPADIGKAIISGAANRR